MPHASTDMSLGRHAIEYRPLLGTVRGPLAFLLLIGLLAEAAVIVRAEESPLVSVVYAPQFKEYANTFQAAKTMFNGLPVEIRPGTRAQVASESSRLVYLITGFRIIGEQNIDRFIKTTLYNGIPVSRFPIVEGWKNVGVQVDYTLVIRSEKDRTRKFTGQAVGIARGRSGTSYDVKLNNNPYWLTSEAFANAILKWQHDLLREMIQSDVPNVEFIAKTVPRMTDDDRPHLFQVSRARVDNDMVVVEIDYKNNFPFPLSIEVEVQYYAVTQDRSSPRLLRFRSSELEPKQAVDRSLPVKLRIGEEPIATERTECSVPNEITRGGALIGAYAAMKIVQFSMR